MYNTSAPLSRLRRSVTSRAYRAQLSRLWRSIRYAYCPPVPNFTGARSEKPRVWGALANSPRDQPECMKMPCAKFGPDPLKTLAVHKNIENRETHTHAYTFGFYRATLCQRDVCCRRVSVCPSVCSFVTNRHCINTAKHRSAYVHTYIMIHT